MIRNRLIPGVGLLLLILNFSSLTQSLQSYNVFNNAIIKMDAQKIAPCDIRFEESEGIPLFTFFDQYRLVFNWSVDNTAKTFRVFTDGLGQTHHRFKQYYKGVELAEVQYLLHEKDNMVFHAHGKLIHGLNVSVKPSLNETQALKFALRHINALSYTWENLKIEAFLKKEQNNPQATYFPKGKLMLSAGHKEMTAENFRLVYRFDIFAEKPISHNYVDVDAHTGEIVGVYSRINYLDVQGIGLTLYNGYQPITVSDVNYPVWPIPASHWHLSNWNNFGGEGLSWWLADTLLGNQGGYSDLWYETLDTDTFLLKGTDPILTFSHRFSMENPSQWGDYDGFDGANIWISTDTSKSWQVLKNPSPQYTCNSLYGFGGQYGEGPGIPGWSGQQNDWTEVTFDLSEYDQQTIQLRFAFNADAGLSTAYGSPDYFCWQIDDILISSSEGILFSNKGDTSDIILKNLYREVEIVQGRYRLRESGRCGIYTYDSREKFVSFPTAVDFIDEDSLFTGPINQPGVSLHWALENTYDYYEQMHSRKSYDNLDSRLLAYANQIFYYPPDDIFYPNNAMWAGNFSVYGAGDGTYYGPWVSLDVVGHEITHGVTQFSSDLIYQNEPGALNESFSDIFGTAIEFFAEGSQGDFICGEDIPKKNTIQPIRSLENPNSLGDPDTYLGNYWIPSTTTPNDSNDWGGVHTNSGVQNYWFYLLCQGGSDVNDNGDSYTVHGIGIIDAEQIAYRNLSVYLMPTSQYVDARQGSIDAAEDLFGKYSGQVHAVTDAWYAVGVGEQFYGIHAKRTDLSSKYVHPGLDSLIILTNVYNPDNHRLEVRGIIESNDHTVVDTVDLFDDGYHHDSTANDQFYGGSWKAPLGEQNYNLHLSTKSLDSGFYNLTRNVQEFTTVGPVRFDSVHIAQHVGERFRVRLILKNESSNTTVANINAELKIDNENITIKDNYRFFDDIGPGQRAQSFSFYNIITQDPPDSVNIIIDIFTNDKFFWRDSFMLSFVPLKLPETGDEIPLEFVLKQNYPNPFNPTTTIRFGIPKSSEVKIDVYNISGKHIHTIFNQNVNAGYHTAHFDGKNLASGLYLYRIQAGHHSYTKKMLLVK